MINNMETLLSIDARTNRPLVRQIQDELRDKIGSGELAPGYKLPSMRRLSDDLGVSVGIVKQAINELTAEGYLQSSPRQGVFVASSRRAVRDIALVLPSVEIEQMGRVVRGVRAGLLDTNSRLIIHAADTDFADEVHLLRYLDPALVAGVIICSPPLHSYSAAMRELQAREIPCVQATIYLDVAGMDAVVVDGVEMGRLAFDHLLKSGHRRIGIVDTNSDSHTHRDARLGAAAALQNAGLEWDELPRVVTDADDLDVREPWARGEAATRRLLAGHSDLSAIIGTNSHLALGAYRAIKASGRHIPDEVSLLAMGSDLTVFSMTEPPMTLVDMPLEAICERAARQLLNIIENSDGQNGTIQLSPQLIERGSVGIVAG